MSSRDRYSAFTVAELQQLSSELGFLAQSVVVDNLTASWIVIDAAGRYVPPFTYGATFPLGSGMQVAQCAWRTPPGVTPPSPSGGQAQLTFTSAELPPSNGVPVLTPSQQTLCTIAAAVLSGGATAPIGGTAITMPNASSTAVVTFTVPRGTNSLILVGAGLGGPSLNSSVKVTGVTSGTVYYDGTTQHTGVSEGEPIAFVFSSAADQQVIVSVGTLSGVGIIELTASTATQAVFIENNVTSPIIVATGVDFHDGTPLAVQATGFEPTTVISAVNAPVTLNFAATPGFAIVIQSITGGYSGATAGAPSIQLANGGPALWIAFVRDGGTTSVPGHFTFGDGGMTFAVNTPVSITLSASGTAGVAGVLSANFTYR